MNTVRLNITLPSDIGEAIKDIKNKSAFITEAIRERLKREEQQRLDLALREGYAATDDEDQKLTREWEDTVSDGIS